jgi:P27 family predicted phage terminase small subunit
VAPLCLSQRAFDIWNELVPLYQMKGLLVQLDSDMLGVYCQMRADREDALETVERDGKYYTTANGLRRLHPAVGVAARSAVAMMRLAGELGLFPRGRAVLVPERTPGGPKRETDAGESWCKDSGGPECKTPNNCSECPRFEENYKLLD